MREREREERKERQSRIVSSTKALGIYAQDDGPMSFFFFFWSKVPCPIMAFFLSLSLPLHRFDISEITIIVELLHFT